VFSFLHFITITTHLQAHPLYNNSNYLPEQKSQICDVSGHLFCSPTRPRLLSAHTTFGYFIFRLPAYAHDFNPDAAGRRGDRCRLRVTHAMMKAGDSHRLSLSYLLPSFRPFLDQSSRPLGPLSIVLRRL